MVSSTVAAHLERCEREAARDRPATETPDVGIGLGRGIDRGAMAGPFDALNVLGTPAFRRGAK